MPNTGYMGTVSKCDPPITINGMDCGLIIRVRPHPETDEPGQTVGTWTIDRIDDLGENLFRLVIRRERVPFSRTVVVPWGGSYDAPYYCTMGGNAANHAEVLRPWNHLSERSVRGDMARTRLEPGDMAWIGNPLVERGYFITAVNAFAVSPIGGVDYTAAGGPVVRYLALDFHDISLPVPDLEENAGALIDLSLVDGLYNDAGFYLEVAGVEPFELQKLERKIFARPDATPDEELYPVDAVLEEGEYWIDGVKFEARMASENENIGNNLIATWYETGIQRWTADLLVPTVIESVVGEETAPAGYDEAGDEDELVGAAYPTNTDGEFTVFVYAPVGSSDYGTGSVEFHFPDEDIRVAMVWSGGAVSRVLVRSGAGEPMEDVSFTPRALSGSGTDYVIMGRIGDVITFEVGAGEVVSVDLAGAVDEKSFATLGVMAWGGNAVKFTGMDGADFVKVGTGGDIRRRAFLNKPGLVYWKDYAIGEETITTVVGNRFETYSTAGSARRRNHYQVVGAGVLRFFSETAPDLITVQMMGEESTVEKPGRCPRVPNNTVNLATVGNVETGAASTDASENRWNWHDEVIVYSTEGTLPFVAGEEIRGRRDAVMDPREGCALEFDRKNQEGSAFAGLMSWQWTALPAEGIFGVVDFLAAGLVAGEVNCWRVTGAFLSHHGNCDARQVNELARSVQVFPELCFEQSMSGGTGATMAGECEARSWGASAFECIDGEVSASALSLGRPRTFFAKHANAIAAGGSLPGFFADGSTGGYTEGGVPIGVLGKIGNVASCTTEANETIYTCPEHPTVGWTLGVAYIDAAMWYVWPYGGPPSSYGVPNNCFGTNLFVSPIDPMPEDTVFKFTGQPVHVPPALRRAMAESEVRAWLPVKFEGLEVTHWTLEHTGYARRYDHSAANPGVNHITITINGNLILESDDGEITYANPDPAASAPVTSGNVGFNLVGVRRKTKNVVAHYNTAYQWGEWNRAGYTPDDEDLEELAASIRHTVPDGDWKSFGRGLVAGTVEDGKWGLVEISGAMRGFLRLKTSRYVDPVLWPTRGGVTLDDSSADLSGYLLGLRPSESLTWEIVDENWISYHYTASGQFVEFDTLEIGNPICGLTPPDDWLEVFKCPGTPRNRMV